MGDTPSKQSNEYIDKIAKEYSELNSKKN